MKFKKPFEGLKTFGTVLIKIDTKLKSSHPAVAG